MTCFIILSSTGSWETKARRRETEGRGAETGEGGPSGNLNGSLVEGSLEHESLTAIYTNIRRTCVKCSRPKPSILPSTFSQPPSSPVYMHNFHEVSVGSQE